jgi:hypothetical protein
MVRGPWGWSGRWGLGGKADTAPQQEEGQLTSENDSVAVRLESSSAICGSAFQLECGKCVRGFSFIAIQTEGLEFTGNGQIGRFSAPFIVL